ncbi:MAG: sulfate adenylyltransferase subunit CysN [Gammaproteobacteria bacterium]|nr:sulfate adenylyltransferase subunit CysN [Gammaproteobacteria bacterium]
MSHQSALIAEDINAYLKQHENKELLRMLTCGSVDDGKSTLIGRLLHDSKMIYEDQFAAIQSDTKKHGTTGDRVDLALLVDGLQAEREQGITIDVAYRYFSTEKRKFIIGDTPGHEQYTRNMATGASTCDLAIILIDARHGVLTQTRRHSYITSLLGIQHTIVAINKMDLVDFDERVYEEIKADYLSFAKKLRIKDVQFIPISALEGDNVVHNSERTPWYKGPALMEYLESIEIASDKNFKDFRLPVQIVNRPNLDFRGFCGTITAGVVHKGDKVMALPSRKISKVKDIVTFDGSLDLAFAGQAITLTLADEIDISRGDVIVHAGDKVSVTNHIKAHLVWMNESELNTSRGYLFKFPTKITPGHVANIDYQIDVNTQQHHATDTLGLNGIAVVDVHLSQPIVTEPYTQRTGTGAFIVIDRLTNLTVGAGMVIEALKITEDKYIAGDDSIEAELNGLLLEGLSAKKFEKKLNAIVRKHYPHWQSKDL